MSTKVPIKISPMRRQIAAIITIALASSFVSIMAIGASLLNFGTESMFRAAAAHSEVIATEASTGAVKARLGNKVKATWIAEESYISAGIKNPDKAKDSAVLRVYPENIDAYPITAGHAPQAVGEIVVSQYDAKNLGLKIGQTVPVGSDTLRMFDAAPKELKIVGITSENPEKGIFFGETPVALTSSDTYLKFSYSQIQSFNSGEGNEQGSEVNGVPQTGDEFIGAVAIVPADGVSNEEIVNDLKQEIEYKGTKVDPQAKTTEQYVKEQLDAFKVVTNVLSAVGWLFASIAIFSGILVVANTFTVTLTQQIRSLALLRLLGAGKSRIRRVVIKQALLVGILGGIGGVALGYLVGFAGTLVMQAFGLSVPPFTSLLSVSGVLIPFLLGVLMAVFAGLLPARAATGVAPLQAFNPAALVSNEKTGGMVRKVLSMLLAVIGAAMMVTSILALKQLGNGTALAIAVGGTFLFFLGVLLGTVFLIKPALSLLAKLAPKHKLMPLRVAIKNLYRQPKRSAATVSALLIASTLMATMTVGAGLTKSTLISDLEARRPFDLSATVPAGVHTDDLVAKTAKIKGITFATSALRGDTSALKANDVPMTLTGFSKDDLKRITVNEDLTKALMPNTLVMGADRAKDFGLKDGQEVSLPTKNGADKKFKIRTVDTLSITLISKDEFEELKLDAPGSAIYAKIAAKNSPERNNEPAQDLADKVQNEVFTPNGIDTQISIPAAEREGYQSAVDTMLMISLGLLAMSILVAIVGVANTLSLSVAERTGENALLRALGTTRHQLRSMLAWEGLVLSLIGAIGGSILGIVFGGLGIQVLIGDFVHLNWNIQWINLIALIVVTLVAGVLASVIPAYHAARVQPASALAVRE